MQKNSYRPDIDGLRAIAVGMVILYHLNYAWIPGGFIGVDVFFVISGYVIARSISEEVRDSSFSLINFYVRRVRRIFPALFTMFLFTSICASVLLAPYDFQEYAKSLVAAASFSSNIFFWSRGGYFDTETELKPLLHTWSLAVEEQYYIVFPLVMMFFRRSWWSIRAILIVAFVASFLASAYGAWTHPSATFYLLPTRAWELLVGALLGVGLVQSPSSSLSARLMVASGTLMVAIAALLLNDQMPFPGVLALPACLGAGLVILGGGSRAPAGLATRLLASRPMRFTGKISYSLYLWHWPIIVFFHYYFADEISPLARLCIIALTVTASLASWRFVETPFRSPPKGISSLGFGGAFAILAVVAGLGIAWAEGFPGRAPNPVVAVSKDVNESRERLKLFLNSREADFYTEPSQGYIAGEEGREAEVVLWGDSHAAVLLPGLLKATVAQQVAIKVLTMSGCYPLPGTALSYSYGDSCSRFNDDVLRYLMTSPEKVVVIAARWRVALGLGVREDGKPERPGVTNVPGSISSSVVARQLMRESLHRTIEKLKSVGKTVYIVDQAPEMERPVPAYVYRALMRDSSVIEIDVPIAELTTYNEVSAILEAISVETGAVFVTLRDAICKDVECVLYLNGEILYQDRNHLSVRGAERVSSALTGVNDALRRSLD